MTKSEEINNNLLEAFSHLAGNGREDPAIESLILAVGLLNERLDAIPTILEEAAVDNRQASIDNDGINADIFYITSITQDDLASRLKK